jgi:tripartite-type tricarboxylate transporter receptor subunit TctC
MNKLTMAPTRRSFVRGSAAAVGFGAVAASPLRRAFAQDDFPSRNISVVVPTREGGGADRLLRGFTAVWKKHLGTNFEPEFYPGASGRVGYELYLNRKEPDAYNLLFGNMGPETIMYVLQQPDYEFPGDYVYFARTDVDPSTIWVRADSPFRTIEDLIEEGKRRTLTVAVSRLPHPASIGALALAEATGAQLQLVPYGGGNPTMAATLTGEVDCSALPSGGPIGLGDQARTLLVFDDENPLGELLDNAPVVNEAFGLDLPPLVSARAFGIHSKAVEDHPDRFDKLNETVRATFDDPDLKPAMEQAGQPWELVRYGDQERCMDYALRTAELAERFKPLLTGKDDG